MRRALVVVLALAACSAPRAAPARLQARAIVAITRSAPSPSPPKPRPVRLVRWKGPVEHLFFHTIVIDPRKAFTPDKLGQGFKDYFVTEHELKAILAQMYVNGWTLVDLHRAVHGTVEVPVGRKPFVLSEDDVNYYIYETGHGLGTRLVLDRQGNVVIQVGRAVTHDDLVPIVDDFVRSHPLFSAQGARGVLAVTGYNGVLGWRTETGDRRLIAGARAVAERLKATGWTFASHTWGHINLTSQAGWIADDTRRWAHDVEPIVGPTDVLVYPFGAPARSGLSLLRAAGFTIQCDIDDVARLVRVDGVTIISRRHIDGIAFRDQVANLKPFFDVASVKDPLR